MLVTIDGARKRLYVCTLYVDIEDVILVKINECS